MENISITKELRALNNLIRRHFESRGCRQKLERITGANGWIIGYLADHQDEDVYQKDLEKEFRVTRSTVSKILILMEQKGLIERHSVFHDARLKKIVLTDKAKELTAQMAQDAQDLEAILTENISKADLTRFCDCIRRMRENLEA